MMYCDKCQYAFEGDSCPICMSRKVRQPILCDSCFLCETGKDGADTLKAALESKSIPAKVRENTGKDGSEQIKLYVPFSRLQEAVNIMRELFCTDNG